MTLKGCSSVMGKRRVGPLDGYAKHKHVRPPFRSHGLCMLCGRGPYIRIYGKCPDCCALFPLTKIYLDKYGIPLAIERNNTSSNTDDGQ